MKIIDKREQEEDKEENKVTPFRLIQGGKEPPSENWLMGLTKDTVFLAREKHSKGIDFNMYCVTFKFKVGVLLTWTLVDDKQVHVYVDSLRFSRNFDLVEIIEEGEDE